MVNINNNGRVLVIFNLRLRGEGAFFSVRIGVLGKRYLFKQILILIPTSNKFYRQLILARSQSLVGSNSPLIRSKCSSIQSL